MGLGLGVVVAIALYAFWDRDSRRPGRRATVQEALPAPETVSRSTDAANAAAPEPAPRSVLHPSAPSPAANAPGHEFVVSGRITDREGRALAGARVLVAAPRRLREASWLLKPLELDAGDSPEHEGELAQTGSGLDGVFRVGVARADELHVAVREAGFVGIDRVFSAPAENSALDLGTLTLQPGAKLRGRVRNGSGRPIAGARIVRTDRTILPSEDGLEWSGLTLATSAADGSFVLDRLALGRISLEVRAPGFVPAARELFADAMELSEWNVELRAAAPITGRIVGGPSGEALHVYYRRADTKEEVYVACEEDGSFVLDGLPPELGELGLHAVRRVLEDSGPFWPATISTKVPARPGDRDVEILVPAPVTFRVNVVDATTREPLSAVELELLSMWGVPDEHATVAAREPAGIHEISALLPWSKGRALSLTHPGHEGLAIGELPFAPGETCDLGTVALLPLEPTRVRVLSSAGEPLAAAVLRAALDDGEEWHDIPILWPARSRLPVRTETTTGADGSTLVYFSRQQAYVLTLEHTQHATLETRMTVGAQAPDELELRMFGGGSVTVHCLDARTAEPLAGVEIEHKLARGPEGWAYQPGLVTDADGRVRLEHLAPGTHVFWVYDDSEREARPVEVVDGAELAITLRHASLEHVRLHGVVREQGLPLAGALLEIWTEVVTDLEGAYEFEPLEPEEIELLVTHPQHGPIHVQTVQLVPPETRLDIALELRALGGVVRDASGAPLAGARLWLALHDSEGSFQALYGDGEAMHLTTSAADGSFGFPAVQARPDLYLVARLGGFLSRELGPLEFGPAGTPLRIEAVLERAATLEVEVQGADSVGGLFGTKLLAFWRGSEPLSVDHGEQAGASVPGAVPDLRRFRFDTLQPGPWSLELRERLAFDEVPPLVRVEVHLKAGDNPPLRLEL